MALKEAASRQGDLEELLGRPRSPSAPTRRYRCSPRNRSGFRLRPTITSVAETWHWLHRLSSLGTRDSTQNLCALQGPTPRPFAYLQALAQGRHSTSCI